MGRATGCILEEDDNPSFSSPTTAYAGPDTSTELTVDDVGTYHYRVKAVNAGGATYGSDRTFTTTGGEIVGGYTEPVEPPALLVAAVGLAAIVTAAALEKRRRWRRAAD